MAAEPAVAAAPSFAPAQAQDSSESRRETIAASGRGVVSVPPDTAMITLGIDVIRTDLAEAQSEATRQATDIINVVKGAGVAPADIRTANYSVSVLRNYNYGGDPTQITGFEVMNQVNVVVRDVDRLGDLMDAAVRAGANSIYGVTFFVEDPKPFSAEARKLAMADARDRAGQLAAAGGHALGRLVSISESASGYDPGPVYGRGGGMGGGESVPVETGVNQIAVNVNVAWELA
jgi:uncharacterized protein